MAGSGPSGLARVAMKCCRALLWAKLCELYRWVAGPHPQWLPIIHAHRSSFFQYVRSKP